MGIEPQQVDCNGCGAKIDIHAGLRSKTFVCDYCGTVNEGEKVVAVQDMEAKRQEFKPWSHLRLGMKAPFLGHEYQIIGRVRSREKTWWWDEWLMYSETGFPLWLQEGEGGFTIYRVFYPIYPVNPWTAGDQIKLDKTGNLQVTERGEGTVAFIEGELTWAAKPGETASYLEAQKGNTKYSIEYTQQEIQYLRGESRDGQEVYNKFGITEALPPPLVFDDDEDDDDDDDWDDDSDVYTDESVSMGAVGKIMLILTLLLGLGMLAMSGVVAGSSQQFKTFTFKAKAATSADEGVLLTDNSGKPIKLLLPKTISAYELRLASSAIGRSGYSGGNCWWAQVDFLKEKKNGAVKAIVGEILDNLITALKAKAGVAKVAKSDLPGVAVSGLKVTISLKGSYKKFSALGPVGTKGLKLRGAAAGVTFDAKASGGAKLVYAIDKAYLHQEQTTLDPEERFTTVHRVNAWFGRFWGRSEGESWNENNYVRQHYFKTKDRGPYFIRVYANNCGDYASRRNNPVAKASLTLAFYKNVWMTRWMFWGGIALTVIVLLSLIWRFKEMFSD